VLLIASKSKGFCLEVHYNGQFENKDSSEKSLILIPIKMSSLGISSRMNSNRI
jgi:hypothetical protein